MTEQLHFTDVSGFRPGTVYCGNNNSDIIKSFAVGGYLYQRLDHHDYEKINAAAHATACSWYLDLQLSWLTWDGFNLGKFLENHFFKLLRSLFEMILAVRKIIDFKSTTNVTICVEDHILASIIAATAESCGISATTEVEVSVNRSKPFTTRQYWKELLGLYLLPKTLGVLNASLIRPSKETRLFFSFAPNHFRAIWPLIKIQQYHNVGIQSVIGRTFRKYSMEQYHYHLIDSLTNCRIWSIYRKAQREVIQTFSKENTKSTLRRKFIFEGISCFDVAEEIFLKLFSSDLPNAIRFYELSKIALSKSMPVISVFGDDASFRPRAAVAACRKLGIPSMLVQHGIIAAKEFYYPYSDYMAVWGEHSREVLVKNGVDAGKLKVTGSCAFSIPAANDACSESRRKILIITQPQPTGFNRNPIPGVVTLASEISRVVINDEIELVVKVHPLEDPHVYRAGFTEAGIKAVVQSKCDLERLIKESIVVITSYSTIAIQAVLSNTPVVCLPSVFPDDTGLRNEDIFYHATSEVDATRIVSKILSGELESKISDALKSRFLARYCVRTGIEATESCDTLIKYICSQNNM